MAFAGAVSVWSGWAPRRVVHPIEDELVIVRELADPSDDRISRRHARIARRDAAFEIADLGSRNGTYVDGEPLTQPEIVTAPFTVMTGRTLFVVVDDLRPYTTTSADQPADALVGATETLQPIIASEDCVLILGPRELPKKLALSVAAARGGDVVEFDARGTTRLETALAGGRPRTLVLEHPERLTDVDIATLATWLETDLCVATCAHRARDLRRLPPEVARRLTLQQVDVPDVQYPEIATMLHALAAKHAPAAKVHASAVEAVLERSFHATLDGLRAWLEASIATFAFCGGTVLRARDLESEPGFSPNICLFPGVRLRRGP